jgi:hypothetical protein
MPHHREILETSRDHDVLAEDDRTPGARRCELDHAKIVANEKYFSTQQNPDRDPESTEGSTDLAPALRRAAAAHGEHEKRTGGQRDENWPDWYAEYIVREQAGQELPT